MIVDTERYGIGLVSKRTNVKIETIRYYEKIGLLDDPGRNEGGNRQYLEKHIQRLKFIRRSRELGFSLEEIRALLTLSSENSEDCHSAQEIADCHLENVEKKIDDLQQLAKVLSNLSEECERSNGDSCPILDSLSDA